MAAAIDLKQPKPSEGGGIEPLVRLVESDLKRVNEIILDKMQSPVALIPQLAGHIIAAGGKRLRPMLTLASARLCKAEGERQMALAACVEFIHTATLLHDDVVDASELRRGLQTANAVFGNKASVLVGDFLFSRAFQLMVEDGSLKVLKALSDASAIIAEGEVHQLMTANDMATDEGAYLEVIRAKTAALFAAACQVGAIVAGRPEADEEALYGYGLNFGIAFQLVDDILDYTGDDGGLGKSCGDDFREGKITLPVVLAYARGDESERAFWRRCLEDLDQGEGDFAHALQLLNRHRAIADSKGRAQEYGARAREAMVVLPDNEARQALLDVVDFCVERLY
ncbi:MAG: polyprenyl synthetase family protein [Tistlia sp.]|uniref:polyprenyl synthetase family protein n=1 Tax=Tistlia sp. TaxID=3057121 RepID=UPI0034A22983